MKFRICFFFILSFTSSGFAQKEIDSLLKKANFELYEHPAKAIQIGIKILNAKTTDQRNRIEALLLVSTAYSSERNYAKSLEYAVKADKELPKINNDGFKFIVYTRLGIQYQQLKIYDKAHSYLDRAIQVSNNTKQKFNIHKLLGFNYAVRGMVYKEQMSCDIAQNYFNKSLYHYSKCPKESIDQANLSVIIYNKGNCFLSLNQIDSAKSASPIPINMPKVFRRTASKPLLTKGWLKSIRSKENTTKRSVYCSTLPKCRKGWVISY